jgi:hypothetical protein
MKKITLLVFLSLLLTGLVYPQVKVTIKLANPAMDTVGIFKWDVQAIVPSGQVWIVGSSNIRIDFRTTPTGKLTVHPDNQTNGGVRGANTNLNNNSSYGWMTTTSINGGTAISLNIVWNTVGNCYHMGPGTYTLGKIRFNKTDTSFSFCTHDTIRCSTIQGQSSVIQDSVTALSYPTQWARTNPSDTCTSLVGVGNQNAVIPTVFKLYNNYPNPFNPMTTIKYDIPKAGIVRIVIFDILGREVETIVNEKKEPGSYEIHWDAGRYASGTYICRIEAGDFKDTKKMVLIK